MCTMKHTNMHITIPAHPATNKNRIVCLPNLSHACLFALFLCFSLSASLCRNASFFGSGIAFLLLAVSCNLPNAAYTLIDQYCTVHLFFASSLYSALIVIVLSTSSTKASTSVMDFSVSYKLTWNVKEEFIDTDSKKYCSVPFVFPSDSSVRST